MVKALFDTNILIDFLNGIPEARDELNLYDSKAISIVSWMEVMAGAPAAADTSTRQFLDRFEIVTLDSRIAEKAVAFRKTRKVKLPDAIIWASAEVNGMLLVTRNIKDFPSDDPSLRMPYRL